EDEPQPTPRTVRGGHAARTSKDRNPSPLEHQMAPSKRTATIVIDDASSGSCVSATDNRHSDTEDEAPPPTRPRKPSHHHVHRAHVLISNTSNNPLPPSRARKATHVQDMTCSRHPALDINTSGNPSLQYFNNEDVPTSLKKAQQSNIKAHLLRSPQQASTKIAAYLLKQAQIHGQDKAPVKTLDYIGLTPFTSSPANPMGRCTSAARQI
ncbi:hypothetical protein HaLaN_08213, partial [Haematococcus lacustris]